MTLLFYESVVKEGVKLIKSSLKDLRVKNLPECGYS